MEASPFPEHSAERSEPTLCPAGYSLPCARLGETMESTISRAPTMCRALVRLSHPYSHRLGWVVSMFQDWGQPLASRVTQL